MTINKRRRLIYVFVGAFFVLGISVILYVSGWRLDFANLKITRVGAIFVRSFPENAEIYLDGKKVDNKSGIFQSGTLINDLFPKNYTLGLRADGYEEWRGSIGVIPSLVSEVKSAVLVPSKSIAVTTNTRTFWVAENSLFIKNGNDLLLDGVRVTSGSLIDWTRDLSRIIIRDTETGSFFWYNLESKKIINLSTALKNSGIRIGQTHNLAADRDDHRNIILYGPHSIFLFDTENLIAKKIAMAGNNEKLDEKIAVSQFFISWSKFNERTGTSTVVIYDKASEKEYARTASLESAINDLFWIDDNRLAVLEANGLLQFYDLKKNEFEKLSDNVRLFKFSGDREYLAAAKKDSLDIFSLNDETDYHRFNLPTISDIKDLTWFSDNDHLFLIYPDKTNFFDLNDVSLINIKTVVNSGAVQYEPKERNLYFLDGSNLKAFGFPKG